MAAMLLGLGPLAGAAPANVAPAAYALPALMNLLNQFQQLHLRFEQQATGPGAERQQGDFYLQRPAQFRLQSVDQPLVVSDGETIYEYDRVACPAKITNL